MEAMIFAAGLGTRLRPLTNNKPKALVEVCGKTLLQHSIDMLTACGATHIIINVHHFADMIKEYIGRLQCPTDISISDESDLLLDTGGGLRKASRLFRGDEPIAIVNVDILTNIDLRQMLQQHIEQDNDATLALRQRHSSRQLLFDSQMRLKGWQNTNSGEQIIVDHCRDLRPFAFSGIHIISPNLLSVMPDDNVFPIIPFYLKMAATHKIAGIVHNNGYWFDCGSVEKITEAEAFLKNAK